MIWLRRFAIAVLAGACVGAVAGWVGLRQLTGPLPPTRPATVAESVPDTTTAAPRRNFRGPRADGMPSSTTRESLVGGGPLASRDSVAVVPDLIGRVEGDARRLLLRGGFTVGAVEFRVADYPEGTVLESDPVAGARVALPAEVRLTLATRQRDRPADDAPWSRDTSDSLMVDTLSFSRSLR
jgi:HAMP domain-containing protein